MIIVWRTEGVRKRASHRAFSYSSFVFKTLSRFRKEPMFRSLDRDSKLRIGAERVDGSCFETRDG